MRAVRAILVVATVVLLQSADAVQACGEKFLVVGRGLGFQRAYAAIYPSSVLVYAQPHRSAAKAIRDPQFQTRLKLAGHRVLLVENDAALVRALDSDRVDLVLTDVVDAERISKLAAASPSAPVVLPVTTKDQAKDIAARYPRSLKSSDGLDRYLSTIDDAMKARVAQKKISRP